jgi:ubiquinol oxidase
MIRSLVSTVISVINKIYCGRPFSRFYVLETLACVPYYAHLSVLNIYKKFSFERQGDLLKMHFLDSWNEFHHLLIMETLEGDKFWYDRLLARSITVVYYWILVLVDIVNPQEIYSLIELVARHAYADYNKFLNECEKELIIRPAPKLVLGYVQVGGLSLDTPRLEDETAEYVPPVTNLYDVFSAIRNQEIEHVKMMQDCRESNARLLVVN